MTNDQKKRVENAYAIWEKKVSSDDGRERFNELFGLIWRSFSDEEAAYFIALLPDIASLEKLTQVM